MNLSLYTALKILCKIWMFCRSLLCSGHLPPQPILASNLGTLESTSCLYLVYCDPFFEAASSDIKLLFSLACSEPLSNYLILSNQCLYFLLQIPTFPKLFCLLFLCRGGKNSYKGWWLDRWGIVEKVAAGKFHSVRMQPPPTPPQLGIISVNLQNININPI